MIDPTSARTLPAYTFGISVKQTIQLILYRDLARNFETCFWDSLLGATWPPGMKNVRTGIRISSYGLTKCLPDL